MSEATPTPEAEIIPWTPEAWCALDYAHKGCKMHYATRRAHIRRIEQAALDAFALCVNARIVDTYFDKIAQAELD